MKIKGFLQFLAEESPYLYQYRKELEKLSYTPIPSLEDGYKFLGDIETYNLKVYENKETGAILAGFIQGDIFFTAIRISCEERSLYVKSMQLSINRKHVKMVNTDKDLTRQNIAIVVYTFVAKRFDLVSDRIQFLGAKDLWQSIAERDEVNVYVFDEEIKDYIRNDLGYIIRYNGSNIDEKDIWGQNKEHQDRLLVATVRDLQ